MHKGISIRLTGAHAKDVARALAMRIVELGRCVEVLDQETVTRLGGEASAAFACRLLTRNGVLVVVECGGVEPEGDRLETIIDANDTPDFAAEKVLDALAERGVIDLGVADYTAEEEEQIRRRLADLGYIE